MSKTKFTKGPWAIDWDSCDCEYPCSHNNYPVGITAQDGGYVVISMEDVSAANAHLIACAPEMYEAMQEFCDRVDLGEVRSQKTYRKFKQILTKARGEK